MLWRAGQAGARASSRAHLCCIGWTGHEQKTLPQLLTFITRSRALAATTPLPPNVQHQYSGLHPKYPQMEKTEKTLAELEIEKNLAHEFDAITEAGATLQPLHGPGCVPRRAPPGLGAQHGGVRACGMRSVPAGVGRGAGGVAGIVRTVSCCQLLPQPPPPPGGMPTAPAIHPHPLPCPPPHCHAQLRGAEEPGQQLLHEQRAAAAVDAAPAEAALR